MRSDSILKLSHHSDGQRAEFKKFDVRSGPWSSSTVISKSFDILVHRESGVGHVLNNAPLCVRTNTLDGLPDSTIVWMLHKLRSLSSWVTCLATCAAQLALRCVGWLIIIHRWWRPLSQLIRGVLYKTAKCTMGSEKYPRSGLHVWKPVPAHQP